MICPKILQKREIFYPRNCRYMMIENKDAQAKLVTVL